MNILSICDTPEIAQVIQIINTIITIIKISVPIILIVALSIDFLLAIKVGDADLLKKATEGAVKKMIAAVLIFLIPSFVSLIIDVVNPSIGYKECLNVKYSASAYETKAESLVAKAESTTTMNDYSAAVIAVSKVTDINKRVAYQERLKAVKEIIDKRSDENNDTPHGNGTGSGDGSGSGSGGTSPGTTDNTSGTGNYTVSYKDGTFYIPNVRATNDSQIPAQSGISGTNPEFSRRLQLLIADAKKAGYKVTISQGHRPYSVQLSKWNSSSRPCSTRSAHIACPGGSRHGFGIAADLRFDGTGCPEDDFDCNAAATWVHANAANYGLKFRMNYEPWHIEPDKVSGGSFGACNAKC